MEHELGLIPHKVSGAGSLPTFGEAWARFGDCIVSTIRYYVALIDVMERDISPSSSYSATNVYGEGKRRAKKVWTP